MDQLERGDEEWESLADRGTGPLRRDNHDAAAESSAGATAPPGGAERSPAAAAPDPEWDSLVERLDRPRPGTLAGPRVKGWWRRLKGGRSEGRR
jgi:hypothetical protein